MPRILLALLLLAAPSARAADDATFLHRLIGDWQAKGSAFGMPAEISMRWSWVLDNRFAHISYKMVMQQPNGGQRVFEGAGYYKATDKNKYEATWFDSGGEMHPITATDDGAALTSIWGKQGAKLGKTIYRLVESDKVEITDFIQKKDGSWHQFNQNTVVRRR